MPDIEPGPLPRFPVPQAYDHLGNHAEVRGCRLGLHVTPGKPKTRVPRLGAAPEPFRDPEFIRLTMPDGRVFDEAIRDGGLEGAAQRMIGRLDVAA